MRSTVKKKVGHGSSESFWGARGRCGFAPLFAGLRMARRVTGTSNLGHAGALLLGVLLSVAVLFVTAIACALLAREFVLPFVLAEVVALSVAAIGFGVSNLVRK